MNQRVHCTLIHGNVEQAVAHHVERDGVARSKRDRAEFGRDDAVVGDVGAQQRHKTAVGVDAALVGHGAIADTGKFVVASHEIAVGNVQGGCHQAADVDRCTLAKQNAIRVHQKHLAVGRQAAEDA